MQPLYTAVKIHNEIELCEVSDDECRQKIERELLKNHISYFIRWNKPSWFSQKKNNCIICINDNSKDLAENVVRSICDEFGYNVKFILKKTHVTYF